MITYKKANSILETHKNLEKDQSFDYGHALRLDRIKEALRFLDNPQENYPSLHIAGTNGKGSTAFLLEAALKANHFRVGLFTSPHIQDLRERIQVGGEKISKKDFVSRIKEIDAKVPARLRKTLTYFEMLTLMAFLEFSYQKVDIGIFEVGLGGRLDATNVIQPLISIITPIQFDHESKLGKTLTKIAREKGGIIKAKGCAVSSEQEPQVEKVLYSIASKKKSSIFFQKNSRSKKGNSYQSENINLALRVLSLLKKKFKFSIQKKKVLKAFSNISLPGRLEIVSKNPLVILDGAHNAPAIERTLKDLRSKYPRKKIHILFGIAEDKNLKRVVSVLKQYPISLFLTRSYFKRAASPESIQKLLPKKMNLLGIEDDPKKAFQKCFLVTSKNDILLVTGSFYLVGDLREMLTRRFYGKRKDIR